MPGSSISAFAKVLEDMSVGVSLKLNSFTSVHGMYLIMIVCYRGYVALVQIAKLNALMFQVMNV